MSITTEIIPDKKLIHVWVSEETDEVCEVGPDWYQNNGTPIDSIGNDMKYSHTEMIID